MGYVNALVDQLVATIGISAALKLAEKFGGRSLYVPGSKALTPTHPIVRAIGMEAAKRLSAEWRNLDVMVPKCASVLREQRDDAIRIEAQRASALHIAVKYGMTMRNVYRILARVNGAGRNSAGRKFKQAT